MRKQADEEMLQVCLHPPVPFLRTLSAQVYTPARLATPTAVFLSGCLPERTGSS